MQANRAWDGPGCRHPRGQGWSAPTACDKSRMTGMVRKTGCLVCNWWWLQNGQPPTCHASQQAQHSTTILTTTHRVLDCHFDATKGHCIPAGWICCVGSIALVYLRGVGAAWYVGHVAPWGERHPMRGWWSIWSTQALFMADAAIAHHADKTGCSSAHIIMPTRTPGSWCCIALERLY